MLIFYLGCKCIVDHYEIMLFKKNVNEAKINNIRECLFRSVFVLVVCLSSRLSGLFRAYSLRRCVFQQMWKCCIMNGEADNLQCSHSTL